MTTVEEGQTIFDIAVQETGTVESMFELLLANGLSPSDDLQPGQELKTEADTENKILKRYFANRDVNSHAALIESKRGGIGYMGIKIDFIVS